MSMRPLYYTVCLLVVLFIAVAAGAQNNIVLSGEVAAKDQQVNIDGDAFLLDAKDSVLVKYAAVTGGRFVFDPVTKGNYLLKVSCFGYEDVREHVLLYDDVHLTVALKNDATALNGVSVTGARKIFTNRNGNLHMNIENSVFAAVPDPVELLSKLPAVQVSADRETVSVIGKGEPLIYIGSQRATIADLRSLPVADIKSIEIINNPSAKYEASGRVVILITRKYSRQQGAKAEITETAMFKRFYHNYAGLNLSYKRNRLELRGNIQYNRMKQWESNGNTFRMDSPQIVSQYTVLSVGVRERYIFGGGMYYQFNDEDYFWLGINGRLQHDPFIITTDARQLQNNTETNTVTHTDNMGQRPYFNTNLNYQKKLGNNLLFLGGQYAGYTRELTSHIFDNYNNTVFLPVQDRYQNYHVAVWTGRADHELKLREDMKWENGLNIGHALSTVLFNTRSFDPQDSFYSDYRYTENIYAAYSQLSGKWGKINYVAGLRGEQTQVRGGFRDSADLQVDKNYGQIFPRLNMNLQLDSTRSLSLDYTRSIQRPDYAQTSQITAYINPFFEWSGNIRLNPAVTDAITAGYQYKQNSLQLTVYRQTNPTYYAASYSAAEHKLRMTDQNFAEEQGIRLDLTVPFTYKIWTSTNMISGIITRVKDPAAVTRAAKPAFYFYSSNQFALPHGYNMSLNGWVQTRSYQGVFEMGSLFAVDFAVSKVFYKKLSCTVSFDDIFRSLASRQQFTTNGVRTDGVYYEDLRALSIALKYSIGGIRDSKYRNKEVNDNAGRIK
jgi:hypothetical protein